MNVLEKTELGNRPVLVNGDGDFIPVVKNIQVKGIKVTVAEYKNTSYELRQIANDFIALDLVKYQIAPSKTLLLPIGW